MKNYIFVGLGPHAKRIYYPFLEKYQLSHGIHLKLLIELKNQALHVSSFLSQRKLQPEKIVYLADTSSNTLGTVLDPAAQSALEDAMKKSHIDGIIISTEPKAHKIYAAWALKNNINVLMDKPITAPLNMSTEIDAARRLYQDYRDLEAMRQQSKSKFYIVCQRRNHKGYVYIKDYLKKFVSDFSVPVSYIDIYHADGAWSLPHEFTKENHPYKYGYGKLMHSGYHFVDLFAWLAEVNSGIRRLTPDTCKIYTSRFTPNDFFNQIDDKAYEKLFHHPTIADFYKTYQRSDYEGFGELDAYTSVQLLRDKNVITSGSINLQQNSFSRRGWFDLPEDTYKGNGRVRHERVNIQVSHFLNIQVHSYQAYEAKDFDGDMGGAGSKDHFDIYIFRNTKLVGGEALSKISLGRLMREEDGGDAYYLGHNERAREITLLNFIEGENDESEFQYHDFTNKLLSQIYTSIAQGAETGKAEVACNM